MSRLIGVVILAVVLLPGPVRAQGRPSEGSPKTTTARPDPAQQRYQQSIREAKNLTRRGEFEKALAHLDRIDEIGQTDREYILLRGTCLRKIGKLDEACRLYRKSADDLIAKKEDPTAMLIELERALREKDDPEAAFQVCLELHRLGGGVGIWVRDEIESLIRVDQLGDKTLGPLRKEIAERPEAQDLQSLLVGTLFFLGRYEESLQEAIALDRGRDANGTVLLEQARLMDEKGVGEPVLSILEAAYDEGIANEELQEGHYLRARALRRLRRPTEAAAAFREATDAMPKGPLAHVALRDRADLLASDLGDLEGGAEAYQELIDLLLSTPEGRRGRVLSQSRVSLADCQLRMGRYEEAEAILGVVEKEATDPESKEEAAFQQAEIRFYGGAVEDARSGYEHVVEAFRGGKRVNDALERILLLTRNDETGALPMAALGQIAYHLRVGSVGRALEIARQAETVCGECPAAEDLLREESLALVELGRIEEAAERADTLASRYADGASAPAALRVVADAMRERDGATGPVLDRYEQLIFLFPKSPEAFEVRTLLRELREGEGVG